MVHNGSTYTNHGCRCGVCRRGNADNQARRRAERRLLVTVGEADVRHGASAYTNWGCRCVVCSTAYSFYRRRRYSIDRRRRMQGAS